MFKKSIFITSIFFCCFTTCFAKDETQDIKEPLSSFLIRQSLVWSDYGLDFEWFDYGLNFEWFKDKKLLKKMSLTIKQEEELNELFNELTSTHAVKISEEIRTNQIKLKRQIELKDPGQPNLAEIESLIIQINKSMNEQCKIIMLSKAKLKILLSKEQRETLRKHFTEKEREQREKMKEQMKGRMGGPGGPGGGMPPW